MSDINDKIISRIAHVKSHIEGYEENNFYSALHNVLNNTGSVPNSLRDLGSYCTAKAVYAWFVKRDIVSVQNYFFANAILELKALLSKDEKTPNGANFLLLLAPLSSKHPSIIKWYANNIDRYFYMDRVANHKTNDFWAYMPFRAIRGEWAEISALCDVVINDRPNNHFINKHFVHYAFYQALAAHDVKGMQKVIDDMVLNKYLKKAASYEGGFTEDLICTPLLVLLNIAKLHGFSLKIDTPLVPLEWVYCARLNNYTLPFDFMNEWVGELGF